MNMNCDCKDWKESWPQILSAHVMASIRGMEYTGHVFKFCPWCGRGLKDSWKDDCSHDKSVRCRRCEHETSAVHLNDTQDMRNTTVEEDKAMRRYIKSKYADVPTSSDDFAMRKQYSPCDNCSNNPLVNKLASGVCHCILGTKAVY